MKVTQKATVALGQHQLASVGNFQTGNEADGAGLQINCRCGWNTRFSFSELPDGTFNAAPYVDGLMATHQIEMMESA